MKIKQLITTAGLLAALLMSAHAQATYKKHQSDYKSTSSKYGQHNFKRNTDPIKYKKSTKTSCWFGCDRDYKKIATKIKKIVQYKCEKYGDKYGSCGHHKDVPEPSILAIFGLGLLGVSAGSAVKRRKR